MTSTLTTAPSPIRNHRERTSNLSSPTDEIFRGEFEELGSYLNNLAETVENMSADGEETTLFYLELHQYVESIHNLRISGQESSSEWADELTVAVFAAFSEVESVIVGNPDPDMHDMKAFYNAHIGALKHGLLESLTFLPINEASSKNFFSLLSSADSVNPYMGYVDSGARRRPLTTTEVLARRHFDIIDYADDEEIVIYNKIIASVDFLQSTDLSFLDDAYLDEDGTDWYDNGIREFSDYILEQLGAKQPWRFFKAWAAHSKEGPKKGNLSDNFNIIGQLEEFRPGAFKLLHEEYGITGFHRYGVSFLLEQLENHGNTDKPYGLIISAVSDHNGALKVPQGADRFLEKFKDYYYVRAIEAEGSIELGRKLLEMDKLYGDEHKISFVFVKAHGEEEFVYLDSSRWGLGAISANSRVQSAQKLFVQEPLFRLDSCSTGAYGGIAQTLSEQLHATVSAPVAPSATVKYGAEMSKDGVISIHPRSEKGRGNEDRRSPVDNHTYKDGVLVSRTGYASTKKKTA